MHVRFQTSLGMTIATEETGEALATICGILIHPDTAKIEGFFASVHVGFLGRETLFLSSLDIVRWGSRVWIRRADALSPPEDRVRLQPLLEDRRPVLGQRMRTESGNVIGTCRDVQFDTLHFMMEWLFPKRSFRWGIAIPISEVLEVRPDAIIVRDPPAVSAQVREEQAEKPSLIPQMPETA
ncbi:hypothetical protein HY285_01660 [Candidatus Peregrinibacteria bacterium]|nr:hypothetical protein [Candidatus Peregrinibacteria bacterium]MBI3816234.1 hypothetical protein [Candidatus Peregrinibacteria bacterium]